MFTSEHAPEDHLCVVPGMIQGRPDPHRIVSILEFIYAIW